MPSPPPLPSAHSTSAFLETLDTMEVPSFKGGHDDGGGVTVSLSPGQPSIESLILEAFQKGFSDVHVGVGEVPRFRNREIGRAHV